MSVFEIDVEHSDAFRMLRGRRIDDVRGRGVARLSSWTVRRPSPLLMALDLMMATIIVLAAGHGGSVAAVIAGGLTLSMAADAIRRRQLTPSTFHAVRPALMGALIAFALAVLITEGAAVHRLAAAAIAAASAAILVRTVLFWQVRSARRRGIGLERTVVIGAGRIATSLAEVLSRHPEAGMVPVGFVDDLTAHEELPLPLLAPTSELADAMREHEVSRAIIAYGRTPGVDLVNVLRTSAELDVELYALPRFFELGTAADGRATDELWGFPLVPLRRPSAHVVRRAKRALDVVIGSALLILTAPIMPVIAALVRATSPGPVLFRQERVGLGGRPYELLKFRSMLVNDECDTEWSVDADMDGRVTPVGRVLRKTHLDELPQLWNVLRGDMSLVGPRPERPVFVERFSDDVPGYEARHRMPTGLTGLAQVNGLWGDTSIEERARFDNLYIEQWSVARDLHILARTIPTLLGRRADDSGSALEGAEPIVERELTDGDRAA